MSNVTAAVDGAFENVRNALTGMAIPDIEGMSEEDRAALQAKVDALPEGLENISGLTEEQLVLLAEDLNMTPEELAGMDSAAVLRATTMDSIGDGISAVGEMASDAVDNVGNAIWSGAEAIGVDDELTAAGEYVGQVVSDVTEGARAYWNEFSDTMSEAKGRVLSFFGFGGDDDVEEPEDATEVEAETTPSDSGNLETEVEAETTPSGAGTSGNLETEPAPVSNFDVSEMMSLSQIQRGVSADNISVEDLERQKELLEHIEEVNGGLSRINQRKMRYINQGLSRAQFAEDILTGQITETLDAFTMEMVPVSQAQIDEAAMIADRMGIDTSEFETPQPAVGQTLNATQAETQDLQAEEQAANSGGGAGMNTIIAPTSTTNVGVQRVQPRTPVRNSNDDYMRSAEPAM